MGGDAEKRDIKGKGKGKEPGPGPASTPDAGASDVKTTRETLSQMAQSAASFLMPGPLATGLAGSSEKGESSRTGEALERAAESSVHLRTTVANGPASFRAGHAEEHIEREEASFAAFLDSSDAPTLTEPSDLSAVLQPPLSSRHAMVREAVGTWEPVPLSVAEQQSRDGADVVALLSSDDNLDDVFTQDKQSYASMDDVAALQKALFGSGTASENAAWDNVLNFIPEFLQGAQGLDPASRGNDLALHLGTADPQEAWDTWISQWSRVLTNYQDEVWGDLGELVVEARAEVERIKTAMPGEKPPEPKALLRLRAILGHLRGGSS
ncbi:hypothetical protein VTJ83DRAFT_2065 [Remersonia thermophila]|uniref:Uncharacterized protein n=1 Tax=Remersonia thermophila TaxID=72144 RepID=A0ABR4DHM9_9PEZI